jgi:DNA-binding XRE family transcriptional regulator
MSDITIPAAEYQELVDARDHAMAMRDVATGAMTVLTQDEALAYLEAPSPIAFWRRHRGLSQMSLAGRVGVSQPYLAQIETGRRKGDVHLYAKLAQTLSVNIEDLIK